MSQAQPLQPNLHPDRDTVPAADLGPGGPDASPGFGFGGEEKPQGSETGGLTSAGQHQEDTAGRAEPSTHGLDDERAEEAGEQDTVFRTPDPAQARQRPESLEP